MQAVYIERKRALSDDERRRQRIANELKLVRDEAEFLAREELRLRAKLEDLSA